MYMIKYYLHNQSELFSTPQVYVTDDIDALKQAIKIANINDYKIVEVVK